MKNLENLIRNRKEIFLPKIEVNENKKEVKFIVEGIFGNNITEAYYTLKGYRITK